MFNKFLLAFANKWVQEGLQAAAVSTGAYLIHSGYLTNSQLSGWIGSIVFISGIAWSAIEKLVITKGN